MPRDYRARENQMMARAKRESALARREIRGPTEPRVSASSPTSFAVKAADPALRKLIDEAIARRNP